MKFNILNKNEFKIGEVITIFKIEGVNEEIALFKMEGFDDELDDLNIAYICKDSDGFDYLKEIEDKNIFIKAVEVVKDIVKNFKINS